MEFKIHAAKTDGKQCLFFYDNVTNVLRREDGFVYGQSEEMIDLFSETSIREIAQKPATVFSKEIPLKKSKLITRLKIQLGLSCNYSCDYCSQKFVERPEEQTTPKDIDAFIDSITKNLEFSEERGLNVEFWGGEPLVYWKTLKPLAEKIQEHFSHWDKPPKFSIITNGSLINNEKAAWLAYMGFSVSISHDGPGQYVRGPDPLDNLDTKKALLKLYKILKPQGRMSFNPIITKQNPSREKILNFFKELTNDPMVFLGEGGIVDSYDEDGIDNSLSTKAEHFEYRRNMFNELLDDDLCQRYILIKNRLENFKQDIFKNKHSDYLPQKCGMDNENVIAIDMRGNVITCQNVSYKEISKNGEPHLGGNIEKIEEVKFTSAQHWSTRKDCPSCPVVHICKGSCMFLDNKYWETSCNNAYSDAVPIFAKVIKSLTGYIPYLIESDSLPDERKDIWGTVLQHTENLPKKVIPIKVVKETVTDENGVEVYKQAKLKTGENV